VRTHSKLCALSLSHSVHSHHIDVQSGAKNIARSLRHVISQTAVVAILMAPCRHTMFSTDVNHMETKAAKVKKIKMIKVIQGTQMVIKKSVEQN
jgi:hypothetical protein